MPYPVLYGTTVCVCVCVYVCTLGVDDGVLYMHADVCRPRIRMTPRIEELKAAPSVVRGAQLERKHDTTRLLLQNAPAPKLTYVGGESERD